MVLTGIALAAIVSMTLTHSRAAVRMESSVRQLEQVRLTADLLSGEIADLPRGAVLFARSDSISYRLPIAWGAMCGSINRHIVPKNKKKAWTPDSVAALYLEPPPSALGSPTPEGFGVAEDGVTWTYYATANWNDLGLAIDNNDARRSCLDTVPIKSYKKVKAPPSWVFYKFPTYKTIAGDYPPERAIFAAWVKVNYFLKTDTEGLALYRQISGETSKLAWPFTSNAEFKFRLADNSIVSSVTGATLLQIRSIQALLPAQRYGDPRWKSDSLEIAPWMPLYNSR